MTAYGWAAHLGALIEAVTCTFRARRRPGNETKGDEEYGKIS